MGTNKAWVRWVAIGLVLALMLLVVISALSSGGASTGASAPDSTPASSPSPTAEPDTTPPVIQITSPEGSISSIAPVTIEGTIDEDAEVTVDGSPARIKQGVFRMKLNQPPLSPILVVATDEAGNETSETRTPRPRLREGQGRPHERLLMDLRQVAGSRDEDDRARSDQHHRVGSQGRIGPDRIPLQSEAGQEDRRGSGGLRPRRCRIEAQPQGDQSHRTARCVPRSGPSAVGMVARRARHGDPDSTATAVRGLWRIHELRERRRRRLQRRYRT